MPVLVKIDLLESRSSLFPCSGELTILYCTAYAIFAIEWPVGRGLRLEFLRLKLYPHSRINVGEAMACTGLLLPVPILAWYFDFS